MGPAFSENRLLAAAHALEGAIGFDAVPTFRDSRERRRACRRPAPSRQRANHRRSGDRSDGRRERAMSAWEPVIGLEVHVELDTETKMFCGCAVTKGDPPNTHTCPVCLAHPGALPVVNERAVEYAARIALALGCTRAAAQHLPPQELLLSRPAQGLPDQPVRRAAGRGRLVRLLGRRREALAAASTGCTWKRTPPS